MLFWSFASQRPDPAACGQQVCFCACLYSSIGLREWFTRTKGRHPGVGFRLLAAPFRGLEITVYRAYACQISIVLVVPAEDTGPY